MNHHTERRFQLNDRDPTTGRDGRDDGSVLRGYLVALILSLPLAVLVALLVIWASSW